MDPWAEQTSLRLLELITCAADGAIESAVAGHVETTGPSPAEVLRELATADTAFRAWLEARAQCSLESRQQAASGNSSCSETSLTETCCSNSLIDLRWLEWLAESSLAEKWLAEKSLAETSPADSAPRLTSLVAATARLALESKRSAFDQRDAVRPEAPARDDAARMLAYDMAYGLSHELNNPLANIASRARLLAEEEPSERKRMLLSSIVDQAMRGCEMISDLMFVARPPVLANQPVDLLALLRELVEQARPWIGACGRTLRVELSDSLPGEARLMVSADRTAVREAIWALLRNAIEAARHQIAITLTVEPATGAGPPAASNPEETLARKAAPPSLALLEICDDGAGLSDQAREHAFNPYFSGREAGRGLGLGLAKADRLARLAGGYVTIDNLSDGGCMVRMALPCT